MTRFSDLERRKFTYEFTDVGVNLPESRKNRILPPHFIIDTYLEATSAMRL